MHSPKVWQLLPTCRIMIYMRYFFSWTCSQLTGGDGWRHCRAGGKRKLHPEICLQMSLKLSLSNLHFQECCCWNMNVEFLQLCHDVYFRLCSQCVGRKVCTPQTKFCQHRYCLLTKAFCLQEPISPSLLWFKHFCILDGKPWKMSHLAYSGLGSRESGWSTASLALSLPGSGLLKSWRNCKYFCIKR